MTTEFESAPEKIECPHCGSNDCFVESHLTELSEDRVASYMCMDCGYTTTSLNIQNSMILEEYESMTPQLILDLKWVDDQSKLVWYPMVLNFPNTGIVFPDGTDVTNWEWRAAPAVEISEEEKHKYPIPGAENTFYTKKVAMEQSKTYQPNQFREACKFIGLIQ